MIVNDLKKSWNLRISGAESKILEKIDLGLQKNILNLIFPLDRRIFFNVDGTIILSSHMSIQKDSSV